MPRKFVRLAILLPIVMLTLIVCSQDKPTISINQVVADFKKDEALKHASWGMCAIDVATGKVLAAHDEERSLIPASIMKLLTTIASLEILGKDHTFETKLQYDGEIDSNGVLNGNLYIKGGGDPTFGSWRFNGRTDLDKIYNKWLVAIKEEGIKKITGDIVGDASIFDEMMAAPSWVWGDIGNYYGSGASGLTVHENLYKVIFKPGAKIDDTTIVLRTEPTVPGMKLENQVLTYKAGSGDRVYIYGAPYRNKRILRGTVPMGKPEFGVKGSIPDPAYFCATTFSEFLVKNAITIDGSPTTIRNLTLENKLRAEKRQVLHTHHSPTLKEIVKLTNMKSINTYAEGMFRMLGVKQKQEGEMKAAITALKDFYIQKGLSLKGVDINDGSGLSRSNCVTAKFMAKMLAVASKFSSTHELQKSLPVAGKSGSIRRLCKGHFAEGNLKAKSGYMSGVRSYAGYVKNRAGKEIAFAIIVNNYETSSSKMKKKIERMLMAIADLG